MISFYSSEGGLMAVPMNKSQVLKRLLLEVCDVPECVLLYDTQSSGQRKIIDNKKRTDTYFVSDRD